MWRRPARRDGSLQPGILDSAPEKLSVYPRSDPTLSKSAQLLQPFDNFLSRSIRSAHICLAPVASKFKKFTAFRVKHLRHRRRRSRSAIRSETASPVRNSAVVVFVRNLNLDMVVRAVFLEFRNQQPAVQILRVNSYPPRLLPHRQRRERAAKNQHHHQISQKFHRFPPSQNSTTPNLRYDQQHPPYQRFSNQHGRQNKLSPRTRKSRLHCAG